MSKELLAINAITHKPKTKIERVSPGEVFTPASEEDREFFIRAKAARELTEDEAKARGGSAKKAPAKSGGKKAPAATPSAEKPVEMDSDKPGAEGGDDDEMLG